MPIYSRVISNAKIQEIVHHKFKKVLLLACGGCMNESLAYDYHLPIAIHDQGQDIYPAIQYECNRIISMFRYLGIVSDFRVLPSGSNSRCMINLNAPLYSPSVDLFEKKQYDAVLVLSCPAGFIGISQQYIGIPIFIITDQKGMLRYTYDDNSRTVNIMAGDISYF